MENSTAVGLGGLRSTRQLDGLNVCLFTHAGPTQARWVVALCGADHLGAVYSLRGPTLSTMKDLVDRHARAGDDLSMLLIDAARYAGNKRVPGTTALDGGWVRAQHEAGLPWAMTDSGYVGAGDSAAVDHILQQSASLGRRVIATMPVHKSWLTQRADELRVSIEASGVPVALMVEDDDDPFDTPRAVAGLIHLLDSKIPILSLRNDISAIGAIAFGAVAGGIGTTTSLRHFFPIRESGGGRPRKTAAIVPQALVYKQLERIADAFQRDPDQLHWRCPCMHCAGKTLDWIVTEDDAFAHSVLALVAIAAHVLNSPEPADRRKSWIEACRHAQSINYEIAGNTGVPWEPPKFQAAWVKACPQITAS